MAEAFERGFDWFRRELAGLSAGRLLHADRYFVACPFQVHQAHTDLRSGCDAIRDADVDMVHTLNCRTASEEQYLSHPAANHDGRRKHTAIHQPSEVDFEDFSGSRWMGRCNDPFRAAMQDCALTARVT